MQWLVLETPLTTKYILVETPPTHVRHDSGMTKVNAEGREIMELKEAGEGQLKEYQFHSSHSHSIPSNQLTAPTLPARTYSADSTVPGPQKNLITSTAI